MNINKKYQIIYADPPWSYNDKSLHRGGAERHYPTMTKIDLEDLPVKDIAEDNAVLFLWVTFPKIQDGLDLIKAWGFQYKTLGFVWIKKNKKSDSLFWGMGHWTRSNPEVCLIATKGKIKRIDPGVHSVIEAPISKHSEKPIVARQRIEELMGGLSKIELFARQKYDGWDHWGNEL